MRDARYGKAQADTPYAGRLAPITDPKVQALLDEAKLPKPRQSKEKVEAPQRCPGCEQTRLLHRGYAATLCQECHDDISERAARKPGMIYPCFTPGS